MSKGLQIRKRREELGLSQTELAEMVSVSKQTLYKYENDIVTNIPSDKVEAIARALHVTPAYIMGWAKQDEIPSLQQEMPKEIPYLKRDYRIAKSNTELTIEPKEETTTLDRIKLALELYSSYEQAPKSVQETIDMILKSAQQKP